MRQGYAVVPAFSPAMLASPEALAILRAEEDWVSRCLYFILTKLCKTPLRPYNIFFPLRTEAQVLRWFGRYSEANIHLALGRKSGVVALDYDPFGEWQTVTMTQRYSTRKVATGSGVHYHFHLPSDKRITRYITSEGHYLKGEFCLSLLPPSVHANGKRYQWFDNDSPLGDLPTDFTGLRVALLTRLRLFLLVGFLHNSVYTYAIYPSFKLAVLLRYGNPKP